MKDPLITTLTTLRDRAPSISYTDLSLKSTEAGHLAHYASDTPVKFSHGNCQYTVWNTWEHFDYLIRQAKRSAAPKYGTNTSQRFPNFRSRRSAEQGFKINKSIVSKLMIGSICLLSDRDSQLFIVDALTKTHIHFAPLFEPEHEAYHHKNYTNLTFELKANGDKIIYLPQRPEWLIFESFLTPATLKLISRFDKELYSVILHHYPHIKRQKLKEKQAQLRIEADRKEVEKERKSRELEAIKKRHEQDAATIEKAETVAA